MSHLLGRSLKDPSALSRPQSKPVSSSSIPEHDDHPPSDSSSSSSADSAASVNTIRPDSNTSHPLPKSHWSHYFDRELHLPYEDDQIQASYHAYLTPPADPSKGPLFICHHGAGASAMSFALLWTHLRAHLPHAGILSCSARGHGSIVRDVKPSTTTSNDSARQIPIESPNYTLPTLVTDVTHLITLTQAHLRWPQIPPTVLLGHSLGAAVLTTLATSPTPPRHPLFGTHLVGNAVFDVVEGSALEALGFMQAYLASRPSSFPTVDAAIDWHVRSRTLRSREAAEISVPSLFDAPNSANSSSSSASPSSTNTDPAGPSPNQNEYTWHTPLPLTVRAWPTWFDGLSAKFLSTPCAKSLVLAGTDRLDKPLMIGQMQGKFQTTVIPEAGHFVHEDAAAKVAETVVGFWERNERGGVVLPMKVGEMLERGMKV